MAEAASVLGWDGAEAAIMDAAQEVLCVQGVEESMLGTMGLNDLWTEVLGAVNDMLVCAAEAERVAEAVREAESVAEAVVEASGGFQFLEALLIWSRPYLLYIPEFPKDKSQQQRCPENLLATQAEAEEQPAPEAEAEEQPAAEAEAEEQPAVKAEGLVAEAEEPIAEGQTATKATEPATDAEEQPAAEAEAEAEE